MDNPLQIHYEIYPLLKFTKIKHYFITYESVTDLVTDLKFVIK